MEVAPIRLYGSANSSGMNAEFQQRLANLFSAAPAEYRSHLGIYSGFRDQAKQDRLFAAAVKKYGSEGAARKWVAKKSEHTAGYAADVGWDGAGLKGAPPAAIKWLHDNAGNYGLHFPLSNENWHIEPVEARPGGKPIYNAALKTYPGLSPIAGHPVPSLDIPDSAPQPMVRPASLYIPSDVPMPRSRPATPSASGLPALPSAAMYGIGRLNPGQHTAVPTDFTTAGVGAPADLRTGQSIVPRLPASDYGQPPVTQAQTMAEQRMGRAVPPRTGPIPPVPQSRSAALGMTAPGNINLNNRPVYFGNDGTYGTEASISIGTDKGEVLIPTIVNGKKVSNQAAIDHYMQTGENMGTFTTPDAADRYAQQVHLRPQGLGNMPVPMPGRPAALQAALVPPIPMPGRPTAPPMAAQAPTVPPPMPRTEMAPPQAMAAMQRPTAPQQQLVRLASGQMIPVGIQQGSNGPVNITNDGSGNAVITKIRNPGSIPGVIDPIKEASAPTLAGSFIRAQIPKVMSDTLGGVQQNLGYAGDALKSNATQAVNNVGNAIGGAFNGLGNLFGGHQAQPSSWWGGNAGLSAYSGTRQPPPMPMSRPALQQVAAAVAAQQQQQNRTPKYAVSTAPGTFNRETGTWN